jgi:hypothetical protein
MNNMQEGYAGGSRESRRAAIVGATFASVEKLCEAETMSASQWYLNEGLAKVETRWAVIVFYRMKAF